MTAKRDKSAIPMAQINVRSSETAVLCLIDISPNIQAQISVWCRVRWGNEGGVSIDKALKKDWQAIDHFGFCIHRCKIANVWGLQARFAKPWLYVAQFGRQGPEDRRARIPS